LSDGKDTAGTRVDGRDDTVARREFGEREQRRIEGVRANQWVSWVASEEVELTGAMSTTKARRQLWNGCADTVNGAGLPGRVHDARRVLRVVSARMMAEEGEKVLGG
jgi:hypothetical protein